MKNTELAKLEGIMNYKDELNKIKPLTKDAYTASEAAKYFMCTKSQIKNYHNRYKDIFGDTVTVEGKTGMQTTTINKDGMFLMGILLSKRSDIGKKLFDNVLSLITGEEQTTMKEVSATVEQEELTINNGQVRTDNIISFEDIAKSKEEEVNCLEITISDSDFTINPTKMKKSEADRLIKETEDKLNNGESYNTYFAERAKELYDELFGNNDKEEPENIFKYSLDDVKNAKYSSLIDKISFETTLSLQTTFTSEYLNICNLLGIDEVDASILIQKSIVERSEDIDKDILNYLTKKKEKENIKKLGILKESVKLLAEEKFDSEKEAYMALAQEMRYFTGSDLTALVEEECYTTILAKIIETNEFEKAMIIIHQFLAE